MSNINKRNASEYGKRSSRKGTPNKITAEIREKFTLLLDNNLDRLQEDIDALEPSERIKILLQLSKFVIPSLRATEFTSNDDNGFNPIVINLREELTPKEIRLLNNELEENY